MKTTITLILALIVSAGLKAQPAKKADTTKRSPVPMFILVMDANQVQAQLQINELLKQAIPYLPATTMSSDQKIQTLQAVDANIAFLSSHIARADSTNTKKLDKPVVAETPAKKNQ